MGEGRVTHEEVVELLKLIVDSPDLLKLVDRSWDEVFAGEVEFRFCGWEITLFNDCDGLDYVDSVRAPDGRFGEFDDWVSRYRTRYPLDDLDGDEFRSLESALKAAKP